MFCRPGHVLFSRQLRAIDFYLESTIISYATDHTGSPWPRACTKLTLIAVKIIIINQYKITLL